jgi:hypothetical protein
VIGLEKLFGVTHGEKYWLSFFSLGMINDGNFLGQFGAVLGNVLNSYHYIFQIQALIFFFFFKMEELEVFRFSNYLAEMIFDT